MYADRPHLQHGSRPASLGAALLISSAVVAALALSTPGFILKQNPEGPLEIYDVKDRPPPPPVDEVKPKSEEKVRDTVVYVPPTIINIPADTPPITITNIEPPARPPIDLGERLGTAEVTPEPPKPLPLLAAQPDPSFADAFQPQYPPSEIRSGREGSVKVRVRIGADGRVKQVEQVSATSPAFFEATQEQALRKWRFKPATRGGVAQESWKVMTVRFELNGR